VNTSQVEAARLGALRSYGILDSPNEPDFDDIVQDARRLLSVPIALISLVDEHRQWFKARAGLEVSETPRCILFCTHALRGSSILTIPDARKDERFASNPLVSGEPHIRFYAGAPLTVSNGRRVGTLCVIDTKPRSGLSTGQEELLAALAARTMEAMERRKARIDSMLTSTARL